MDLLQGTTSMLRATNLKDDSHELQNFEEYLNSLTVAIINKDQNSFDKLLKLLFNKNILSNNNNYLLHLACESGIAYFVNELLKNESVRNRLNNDKKMHAFMISIKLGYLNIIKSLFETGFIYDKKNYSQLLMCAAYNNHTKIIKYLLSIKEIAANAHLNNNGAIFFAIYNGNFQSVKILLDNKHITENLNSLSVECVSHATKKGYLNTIKTLLDSDIFNHYFCNDSSMQHAIFKETVSQPKILLEILKFDNIKEKASTPLLYALEKAILTHQIEIIDIILSIENTSLNFTFNNNAILLLAAKNNLTDVFEKLIHMRTIQEHEINNNGLFRDEALRAQAQNRKKSPYSTLKLR